MISVSLFGTFDNVLGPRLLSFSGVALFLIFLGASRYYERSRGNCRLAFHLLGARSRRSSGNRSQVLCETMDYVWISFELD